MVLVHGGEGTAFAKWVRLWNERGYAAIAMDTCIAAGVDDRYLFAVPVYGCGFYGEGSAWKAQLERLGNTGRRWLELWDASVYLPNAKCPFFWVSGKDDPFFPYESLRKSAALVRGPSSFHVADHMTHGQNAGSTPEYIRIYADRLAK